MIWTDDPVADAMAYNEEMERRHREWLMRSPICEKCGEHIDSDWCYKVGFDFYCEECMSDMMVMTDKYVK